MSNPLQRPLLADYNVCAMEKRKKNPHAVALGRLGGKKGGKKGGKARWEGVPPEERKRYSKVSHVSYRTMPSRTALTAVPVIASGPRIYPVQGAAPLLPSVGDESYGVGGVTDNWPEAWPLCITPSPPAMRASLS
jgi:hypothetical protein